MPAGWSEVCRQEDHLFHSSEWMELLERSFGCTSIYAMNSESQLAAGISSFRAGPFRVGYLGFPVGGLIGDGSMSGEVIDQLRSAIGRRRPVCLRIPVSAFSEPVVLDLPHDATPETAIVDLQSWDLAGISKNRRRDVNRSLRSGLDLVDASDPADGARIYQLYQETLERKDGSLRYNNAYFTGLIELAQRHPRLRVLLAMKGDQIAAFTVVALHGSVAYYLHGAYDWSLREYLPSAMLLNEAIEWAKSVGCETFSLMSSPKGQESLVRYKERWGAETREHRTYTLPMSWTYGAFRVAEWLYRQAHRS
jgi:hypothetical protein